MKRQTLQRHLASLQLLLSRPKVSRPKSEQAADKNGLFT
jgi:hypothetical protein